MTSKAGREKRPRDPNVKNTPSSVKPKKVAKARASSVPVVAAEAPINNGGTRMAEIKEPVPAPTPGEVFANGAKALGEIAIVPGASLIADGDLRAGVVHSVIGITAGIVFGPLGWLAVAANSYSRSITGHHLYEHFVPEKWIHRRAVEATA